MVQKFVFDPRTLIDEEKENEKKKVTEVLSEQKEYDKIVEEQKAKTDLIKTKEEKKSRVGEAFEEIKDILKEVNYYKKYGGEAYLRAKKEEDPDHPMFDPPLEKLKQIKEQFSDLGAAFRGEFKGEAQAYTLAQTEDPEKPTEKKKPSVFDVDVNNVG